MRKKLLYLVFLLAPNASVAETSFVNELLFNSPCMAAIEAATEYRNGTIAVYNDDEKVAAYAFFVGLGGRNSRPSSPEEAFGRGIGGAAFFCGRNPDASIHEIAMIMGRE